jgi:hypothetical protein
MRQALLAAGAMMLVAACSPAPAPTPAPPAAKPAPVATCPPPKYARARWRLTPRHRSSRSWELPGDLGPLTTQAQLEARFGKANLREETFDGAEGIGHVSGAGGVSRRSQRSDWSCCWMPTTRTRRSRNCA